jgi:hypothetical protein
LNTGIKSGYFGSIFSQANTYTAYGSVFQNNMDNSSFNDWDESLFKTITLPRQAFAGFQESVAANSKAVCKVSL